MIIRVIGILVSVACAAFMTGCASGRVDLFDAGVLRLEEVPDKRGQYRDVHAYQTDIGVMVVGYLRRSTLPAHVHVLVETAERQTIASRSTSVRRVPRSSRIRQARFETVIPIAFTDGLVVSVRHHVGQCEEIAPGPSTKPAQSNGV